MPDDSFQLPSVFEGLRIKLKGLQAAVQGGYAKGIDHVVNKLAPYKDSLPPDVAQDVDTMVRTGLGVYGIPVISQDEVAAARQSEDAAARGDWKNVTVLTGTLPPIGKLKVPGEFAGLRVKPKVSSQNELGPFSKVEPTPQEPAYKYEPLDIDQPVAGREVYHGTKSDVTSTEDLDASRFGTERSLFGPGTYVTDHPSVASDYAVNKGKGAGRVLKANLGDVKLLDAERPAADEVRNIFLKNLPEMEPKEGATLAELYGELKDVMEAEGFYSGDAHETFTGIAGDLQNLGYDGLRYEGGKRVKESRGSHNAVVLFPQYEGVTAQGTPIPKKEVLRSTPFGSNSPVVEKSVGSKQEKIQGAQIDDPSWVAESHDAETRRLQGVLKNPKATPEELKIAKSQLDTHNEILRRRTTNLMKKAFEK